MRYPIRHPLLACAIVIACACAGSAREPVVPENKGLLVPEREGGNVTLYVTADGTEGLPIDLEVSFRIAA